MVFGESAGAGLAWIMSTMSSAPSLMKAALAESGAGALIPYGATFQQYGAEFAQKLGCSGSDVSRENLVNLLSYNVTDSGSADFMSPI